jgi:glyoxylase-like metal-dependent hydrolase (beta-lactamase superfamily II)
MKSIKELQDLREAYLYKVALREKDEEYVLAREEKKTSVHYNVLYCAGTGCTASSSPAIGKALEEACEKYGFTMPPFKPISEGDTIDLGGKTLEVYELPGHTQGGIVLLLKEDRILFTGDSINHHLWMMLDGCLPMEDYIKALDRIMFLEDKADYILHGHARDFDDISLIRCLRQGAVEICEGKTSDDGPYEWFGGVARQHHFKLLEGKKYSQEDNSLIVYNLQEN